MTLFIISTNITTNNAEIVSKFSAKQHTISLAPTDVKRLVLKLNKLIYDLVIMEIVKSDDSFIEPQF